MIKTRITDMFGLRLPVVMGAMQWLTKAEMVAAVAKAGGLGFLPAASFKGKADLLDEIKKTQDLAGGKPFGVNVSMLPELVKGEKTMEYFEAVAEGGVRIVETSGRNPEPFVGPLHQHGIKIIHKVPAVRFAVKAEKVGVDAVTVVGYECGGHPGMDDVTSLVLAPKAAAALTIPLLVGGGFADGAGLAAALCLGADGVVMGTRFLMTQESPIHPEMKAWLAGVQETDTTLILRSLNNAARVIDNRVAQETLEAEARGADLEEILSLVGGRRGREAWLSGDRDGGALPCGQVIGRIEQVLSVAELFDRIEAEAKEALSRLQSAVG